MVTTFFGEQTQICSSEDMRELKRCLTYMNRPFIQPKSNVVLPPPISNCKGHYVLLNPKLDGAPNKHYAVLATASTFKYHIKYDKVHPKAYAFYNEAYEFDYNKIYIAKVGRAVLFSDIKLGYLVDIVSTIDIADPYLDTVVKALEYSNIFACNVTNRRPCLIPKLNKVIEVCIGPEYVLNDYFIHQEAAKLAAQFYVKFANMGDEHAYEKLTWFIKNPVCFDGMDSCTSDIDIFIKNADYMVRKSDIGCVHSFKLGYNDIRSVFMDLSELGKYDSEKGIIIDLNDLLNLPCGFGNFPKFEEDTIQEAIDSDEVYWL